MVSTLFLGVLRHLHLDGGIRVHFGVHRTSKVLIQVSYIEKALVHTLNACAKFKPCMLFCSDDVALCQRSPTNKTKSKGDFSCTQSSCKLRASRIICQCKLLRDVRQRRQEHDL